MKNEEISLYTKKTFSEALKRAMKKKPFQKITVSDLVRDCAAKRDLLAVNNGSYQAF